MEPFRDTDGIDYRKTRVYENLSRSRITFGTGIDYRKTRVYENLFSI